MAKIWVTVAYPARVEIDFDIAKLKEEELDQEYIDQKRSEAYSLADKMMDVCAPDPVIHDAEIPVLIE